MKILPAEWAPQEMIQLTWPHEQTDWAAMMDEVNACFVDIARAVLRFQSLLIVCSDRTTVRALLGDVDESRLYWAELPSNDTWARDHGGITVIEDGKRVVYDFGFNGWGGKFEASLDNQITLQLFQQGVFGAETEIRDCNDFILEGGSIESDGEGTLLTTSTCLLAPGRNPIDQDAIEKKLTDYFGLERVLWVNHGYLEGDDTDAHIDTLVRLCDKETIAYVQCTEPGDPHYEALQKMEAELKTFKQINGEPYRLIALPMADAQYDEGDRLPATYANFLIMNEAVLVPTYASDKDEQAIDLLRKAFPNREIIGIDCRALIKQHGSLHCVTMQYPILTNIR